jgi:proteasome accessory factor B
VSRKTERLVNLTIALLATKRYITKSEIFRTVDGYEGSDESKERMFERDKDDLRNLGIEIEVGTFDPLFEDESGYRIKPENYLALACGRSVARSFNGPICFERPE